MGDVARGTAREGEPIPTEEGVEGGEETLLAGKYKSVDDLVKGYEELQRKFSSRGQTEDNDDDVTGGKVPEGGEEPNDDSTEMPEGGKIPTGDESKKGAEAEAEANGVNLDSVLEEFADNDGSLPDATYERLEKAGMNRQQVDAFIAGQQALADRFVAELAETAGGQETFKQVLIWAKDGADAEEVAAYNEAVDAGNTAAAKAILRGLRASYEAAEGSNPNLVNGENTPRSTGLKPFANNAEVVKAMQDPRYETDPEYIREVEQRLAIS